MDGVHILLEGIDIGVILNSPPDYQIFSVKDTFGVQGYHNVTDVEDERRVPRTEP